MYRIWQSNGTVVLRGEANDPILMRVVYRDVAPVFLGYQLLQKLGVREAFRLLGVPIVELDKDPNELTDEEFVPGTLFFFGPSPGRKGGHADNTRGKWLWRFRPLAGDRGADGMSESAERVLDDSIPAVAQYGWVSITPARP